MNAMWSSLGWFALVLLAIPVLLWLFKISPLGRLHGLKPPANECPMRPMGTLALSPSQKLVTVEVGQGSQRRWLVLGVSPGGITTLDRIEPGAGSASVASDPALRDPGMHTAGVHATGFGPEAADTGMMATQRLDRVPERHADAQAAHRTASVLPFADVLARLRRAPSDERHG
jgi:flagellar protein FliO/FliZ